MGIKEAAKLSIDESRKAYIASDNSLFVLPREKEPTEILKHCTENGLTLFDVEENKFIEVNKKNERTAKS